MRIDVHTHAFHPKIAHKVIDQLEGHYGIKPEGNGLLEDLLEREKKAGVDKVVLLSAATKPDQVIPANNWSIALNQEHPEVIAFGTMHPDYHDPEAELDRLEKNNITGLKFHPEFQGFFLDDPKFLDLMEIIGDRFTLMFHVGDVNPPDQNPSCPYKIRMLRDRFSGPQMIAAHMGGYLHWDHVIKALAGSDVYMDTSSTMAFIDPDLLEEIFNRHSSERILFGSDYPLFDPGSEVERLRSMLNLSESKLDDLLKAGQSLFV